MKASAQEKRAYWRNTILHYQKIHHSCLNHPAIKGPPWVMAPVGSIVDSIQSIDYSQDGTHSAHLESPKKRGRPLNPMLSLSTPPDSYPLSRSRPPKTPTEASKGDDLLGHMMTAVRGMNIGTTRQVYQSHITPPKRSLRKMEALCQFIDDTQELLEKIVPGINTQICKVFTLAKPSECRKI
jgi:hypothetical protein